MVAVMIVVIAAAHQVLNANVITPAEALAIVVTQRARHMRMPKLVPVVHVGGAVVPVILARTLDAIVKPVTPRLILKLRRRRIPSALVTRRRRPLRWSVLCICRGGANQQPSR
jgi:hypothetical protein